jgi:hypothetical protein
MQTPSCNLNMFKKALNEDSDMKTSYIEKQSEKDSDSEDEPCKLIIPRSKKTDNSQELLFQFIKQNQVIAKMQKKIYKLQTELDTEEVVSRYIKLDFNNTQVKLDETNDILIQCNKKLDNSDFERGICRITIIFYTLLRLYFFIFS